MGRRRNRKWVAVFLTVLLWSTRGWTAETVAQHVIPLQEAVVLMADVENTVLLRDALILASLSAEGDAKLEDKIRAKADAHGRVAVSDLIELFDREETAVDASTIIAILARDRQWDAVLTFLKNAMKDLGPTISNDNLRLSLADIAHTKPANIDAVYELVREVGTGK